MTRAAVQTARTVIAQVNPRMPRTHGDGLIHVDAIDYLVEVDEPIPELPATPLTDVERAIGRHCAELVDDGATLQLGIGAIPQATLAALGDHQRLGIHTEMLSDGVVDLVEKGVITGEAKRVHPGKIVAGFALGHARLYDFLDDNPLVAMLDIAYVNDTAVIRAKPEGHRDQQRASRSTSPARSAPTRSATGSTRASAARWTSSAARRCPRAASPSSRCPRSPRAGRVAHRLVPEAGRRRRDAPARTCTSS